MIPWTVFLSLVTDPGILNKPIDRDVGQLKALQAGPDVSLYMVAGPGTGKTTVLALRVLKLVFVDGVEPASILATTFTRKAASELRSRILGWGDRLRAALVRGSEGTSLAHRLARLDLNRIITGTLDSIAEQILTDFRQGNQPPVVIEEFVADALLQRTGLWHVGRYRNTHLQEYVQYLRGENRRPGAKELRDTCSDFRERLLHDQVDIARFEEHEGARHPGVPLLCQVVRDYDSALRTRLILDYAGLEQLFLDSLRSGALQPFLDGLRAVLVDEYQDTNLLQEQIYFALARAARTLGGSIAVVGDDDQSLFRFRGATVDLFSGFRERLETQCGIQAAPVYLRSNYRSTKAVVDWCSSFVQLDPAYSRVRTPDKPSLLAARTGSFTEYPVMGMFRPDVGSLAHDLARLVDAVFNRGGVTVAFEGREYHVARHPKGGALGDCALLCASPREYGSGGRERLPLLLRRELSLLQPPVSVFNPRGQEFSRIPVVEQLCGLILECIDPHGEAQPPNVPDDTRRAFERWRQAAESFVQSDPPTPDSASTPNLRSFRRASDNART